MKAFELSQLENVEIICCLIFKVSQLCGSSRCQKNNTCIVDGTKITCPQSKYEGGISISSKSYFTFYYKRPLKIGVRLPTEPRFIFTGISNSTTLLDKFLEVTYLY